jgi:predicted CoA-substrate-specific enzyme activase
MMRVIGIDSGSTTTKGVVLCGDEIEEWLIVPTGYNPRQTMQEVYQRLKKGLDTYTVTTGYGRMLLPESDKSVTEITCHAKGAHYLCPTARAVVDIGGQDSKAIALNAQQSVSDFLMNDKCAAGTGRFIEVMMRTLHRDLTDLDEFVRGYEPVPINSMCTVFAESEMIGLLSNGEVPNAIAMGVIDAICKRTATFTKRLSLSGTVFFSGGLAQSEVIRATLEKHLGCQVITHERSQFAGAIGAALMSR